MLDTATRRSADKYLFGPECKTDKLVNIDRGKCLNNCAYCMVPAMRARRAGPKAVVKEHLVHAKPWSPVFTTSGLSITPGISYRSVKKVITPPNPIWQLFASHDTYPSNIDRVIATIHRIMSRPECCYILMHTKPHLFCTERLIEECKPYKNRIIWRISISSAYGQILKKWEPAATSFRERLECVKLLHSNNYRVGVSCTPILSGGIHFLYNAVKDYISEYFTLALLYTKSVQIPDRLRSSVESIREHQLGWLCRFATAVEFNKNVMFEPCIARALRLPPDANNHTIWERLNAGRTICKC